MAAGVSVALLNGELHFTEMFSECLRTFGKGWLLRISSFMSLSLARRNCRNYCDFC